MVAADQNEEGISIMSIAKIFLNNNRRQKSTDRNKEEYRK